MKFWIMLNGVQLGPMGLEEVRRLPLTPDTPVWAEGFADWVPAREVAELRTVFGGAVPPSARGWGMRDTAPRYAPGYSEIPPEPPTYLAWSILVTLFCCLPLGIVAIVYSAGVSSAYNAGRYDEARSKSAAALNWIIASVVLGLVGGGLYLLFAAPLALLAI